FSRDEGKTWPISKTLHSGPTAYSCMAVLPDRTIACLYECGEKSPYEKLTLARFSLAWLTGEKANVHLQLLDPAATQEEQRRARFAAVKTKADLEALQKSLREKFLHLIDGLPQAKGPPPAKVVGKIEADDYVVEKLLYESFPGYFVPALL